MKKKEKRKEEINSAMTSGKPMNQALEAIDVEDLMPHYLKTGSMETDTFCQALLNLNYYSLTVTDQVISIQGEIPDIKAGKSYVDRLTDTYLILLATSSKPVDQAFRDRFSPEEIRSNLFLMVKYSMVELTESRWREKKASFWQRLTSWR